MVVVRILIGSLGAARGQSFGEQLSSDSMSPPVDAALIQAMVAEKMQVDHATFRGGRAVRGSRLLRKGTAPNGEHRELPADY